MSHIKTYVLILSKDFPLTHRKAGTPTSFADLVASGKKIHTIRGNYDLWDQRIKDVQEGKAVLSLRQWTGRPYASEQVEIQQLTAESGVGIQKIEILHNADGADFESFVFTPRNTLPLDLDELSSNDGLTREDWEEWYKHGLTGQRYALIHFTSFRYWL